MKTSLLGSIALTGAAIYVTSSLTSAASVQNCTENPVAKFPHNFSNWKCPGLKKPPHRLSSNDLEGCAAACCEQANCEIYQWCAADSLCAQLWGPGCFVGQFGADGPAGCVPDAGWQSASRSVSPPSCHKDEECNLNGECRSGECICNPGWTGADCGQLNLVPIKLVPIPQQQVTPTRTHTFKLTAMHSIRGTHSHTLNPCTLGTGSDRPSAPPQNA